MRIVSLSIAGSNVMEIKRQESSPQLDSFFPLTRALRGVEEVISASSISEL